MPSTQSYKITVIRKQGYSSISPENFQYRRAALNTISWPGMDSGYLESSQTTPPDAKRQGMIRLLFTKGFRHA